MVLYPNKLPESERVCSGICTLETVASDLYISQYKVIEKELSLKQLRCKVHKWIEKVPEAHFPIHLYVSPHIGVLLFRLRWWGGRVLRTLKMK